MNEMNEKKTRHAAPSGERATRTEALAARLSKLLIRLMMQKRVSLTQFAEECGVDKRTVERDVKERLRPCGQEHDLFIEKDPQAPDCWRLTDESRKNLLPLGMIVDMVNEIGLASTYPFADMNSILGKDAKKYIVFYNNVHENLRPADNRPSAPARRRKKRGSGDPQRISEIFIDACRQKRMLTITYVKRGATRSADYEIAPYKLAHYKGIWYLVATVDGRLKPFTVTGVDQITTMSTTFEPDPEVVRAIDASNTIYYTGNPKDFYDDVKIRVAPEVKEYFVRLPQLPNVTSQEEQPDGSLIVTCANVHYTDIKSSIGPWVPEARIIAPESLRLRHLKIFEEFVREESGSTQKSDKEGVNPRVLAQETKAPRPQAERRAAPGQSGGAKKKR